MSLMEDMAYKIAHGGVEPENRFPAVCPHCGHHFSYPDEDKYIVFYQVCPNCEETFKVEFGTVTMA